MIFAVSELDSLRTQTQTVQSEYAAATSQTAAMMSLNLKLQSTASKNQAKNIDLEIKRIEAREARELLTIVQVSIMSSSELLPLTKFSHTCLKSTWNRIAMQPAATCYSSAWLSRPT